MSDRRVEKELDRRALIWPVEIKPDGKILTGPRPECRVDTVTREAFANLRLNWHWRQHTR